MNLKTYSKFYYNFIVTQENQWIDFNDGSGVKSAKIPAGAYTLTSLAIEISSQMNALTTTRVFTCLADRNTRIYNISATGGTFSLPFLTGPYNGLSIFSLIGFPQTDVSGSSSYNGSSPCGDVYYPQYLLQNYVDADNTKYPLSTVVNRSSSGNAYEVVKFGSNKLYKFEIAWTTDVDMSENSFIRSNPTGVQDLNLFMDYVTNKYPVEFIKDESNPNDFDQVILESTAQNQDGVSYELIPNYDGGAPEFYSLGGPLIFRRVN